MTKWRFAKLKNLPIELIDGDRSPRYPKRSELVDSGVLFLNTSNIVHNALDLGSANFISHEKFSELTKGKLSPFDIIITTRGTIGKLALFNCEYETGFINAQMLIVRSIGSEIDQRFLFYVLTSDSLQNLMINFASGSAQPQLPVRDLQEIPIPLPPLHIQRKIAAILSAYDDLIENNNRRIKLLEQAAQDLYREWFVHFRFPGHEAVEMVDSGAEYGMIPRGWGVSTLGEECNLVMGQSPKSQFYNETGEGLPFHQGVGSFGHRFPIHNRFTTVDKRIANDGDILFSVRAPVGRMNIADTQLVVGRGLSAIRSKHDYQAYILEHLITTFHEEDMIGGGTIFKSVTKNDMQNITLLMPKTFIVKTFEEYCRPMYREIEILTKKNTVLQEARDILLPRLVSGEFDVSEIEIQGAGWHG